MTRIENYGNTSHMRRFDHVFSPPPLFCASRTSISKLISRDINPRNAAIYGVHGCCWLCFLNPLVLNNRWYIGGQVNVTDGKYVYMRGFATPDNTPLYEYTLMPTHMRTRFEVRELQQWEKYPGFKFMKGCQVMQIPSRTSQVMLQGEKSKDRSAPTTTSFFCLQYTLKDWSLSIFGCHYLAIFVSSYVLIALPISLSYYQHVVLYIYLLVGQSVGLSVYLSAYLPMHPCIHASLVLVGHNPIRLGRMATLLFDVQNDPAQLHPLTDSALELRMIRLMLFEMARNDCPREQYERLGLPVARKEHGSKDHLMMNYTTLGKAVQFWHVDALCLPI